MDNLGSYLEQNLVLVTGAGGYLGKHIISELKSIGKNYLGVIINETDNRNFIKCNLFTAINIDFKSIFN